jgi:hypothetical protein
MMRNLRDESGAFGTVHKEPKDIGKEPDRAAN